MSVDLIIEGAVAKIVLNRPEKLNALTREMRAPIARLLRSSFVSMTTSARSSSPARAAPSAPAPMSAACSASGLRAEREKMQGGSHQFLRVLHAIEKPVIAAVRGPTVGIGWRIALACDLIVASETARFSQVFRRIGLAPDGGAIWFLTRRIGMARAKELVFTARFVEAPEALSLGLVNHVVPDGELMAKAEELAADLATGPTFAFGMAKKLFHMASGRATRTSSTWKRSCSRSSIRPRTTAKVSLRSRKSGSRTSSAANQTFDLAARRERARPTHAPNQLVHHPPFAVIVTPVT